MNWKSLGKWDPIIIGTSVGLLFAVWLFLAFGPLACFSLLQTLILAVAAYIGLKTWQSDRYDPLIQEVHRQQIAVYRKLLARIHDVAEAGEALLAQVVPGPPVLDQYPPFSMACKLFNATLVRQMFLLPDGPLNAKIGDFLNIATEIGDVFVDLAEEEKSIDSELGEKLLERLADVRFACMNEMRSALGITQLSKDFRSMMAPLAGLSD